jgi:hypothetical protein
MKTNFTRWLPSVAKTPTRKAALAAAGIATVCGGVAGPIAAAEAGTTPMVTGGTQVTTTDVKLVAASEPAKSAPATKATLVSDSTPGDKSAPKGGAPHGDRHGDSNRHGNSGKSDHKSDHKSAPAKPAAPAYPAAKQLTYQYQGQINFYYCGPAATRIALSAHGYSLSQDEVASKLGTTINGTPSAVDTTRVLNSIDGPNTYHTTDVPHKNVTPKQTERFRADVMRAINHGNPVVANIAGTATDTLGGTHSYDGGHYVTVVGYADDGHTVLIADPADTVADGSYWMSTADVTTWMGTHGYSS